MEKYVKCIWYRSYSDSSDLPLEEEPTPESEPLEGDQEENVVFEDIIKRTVGGPRPHSCTMCEKSFKKSSHLKQHVRSHTGNIAV